MATGHLHAADPRLLFGVLQDARAEPAGEFLPWALLDGLQRLVPCDLEVNYQHYVPRDHVTRLRQATGPDGERWIERAGEMSQDHPFWQHWPTASCSWPQRSGDLWTVIHTGDFFPTQRERRADPMICDLPEVQYAMVVSLPAPSGEVRRVCFQRTDGPAFTERDRQLAALLRPHLQEIALDAERRRRRVPELSPREWEVLEMAATGMPNTDIAADLFVSVATVRKHMEHVRERLGVHSVMAAAALALPRPAVPTRPLVGVRPRVPARPPLRNGVR